MKRFNFYEGIAYIIDRNSRRMRVNRKKEEPEIDPLDIMIQDLEKSRDFLQNEVLLMLKRYKDQERKKDYSLTEEEAEEDVFKKLREELSIFSPFKGML